MVSQHYFPAWRDELNSQVTLKSFTYIYLHCAFAAKFKEKAKLETGHLPTKSLQIWKNGVY
jgi:hypothetical protein